MGKKFILICLFIWINLHIEGGDVMALDLRSNAFEKGDFIPVKYTCKGEDVSPDLNWSDIPDGTKSFALICDDPDAPVGTWVHWVIFDIPADKRNLPEGVSTDEVLPDGTKQGINDFGNIGYGGPCPPPGPAHRYFFKLYALDTMLNLKPGIKKGVLLNAMKGHILDVAELIGRFKR